jgi:hypothetical protein
MNLHGFAVPHLRALKRFLVRAIWRLWQECVRDSAAPAANSITAAE